MAFPDGPSTLATAKAWLNIDDNIDDQALTLVVGAVNESIRSFPVAQPVRDASEWPVKIQLGAAMLAARLWRRRDTPAGVEAFGGLGVAYVRRNDPDVAQLLELDAQAKPAIG